VAENYPNYAQPNYNQTPYPGYNSGYNPYSNNFSGSSFKRINLLEVGVVLLAIVLVIGAFAWGLITTNTENRDKQRAKDIAQVINALDNFYLNSNRIPSQRIYPIAKCSSDLNEVDFEATLRSHLIGERKELDSHAYIKNEDFPRDKWGIYDVEFSKRSVPFRCPNLVGGSQAVSYTDKYPSCNFSSTKRINKCYLYTTSNNGDTYQIGFYSESQKRFIVYKKVREEPLQLVS
jgi:hypothetical protein